MANETELKARMESIEETRKITNAMYMISSTKMRKAKQDLENTEPYFYTLQSMMARLLRHLPDGQEGIHFLLMHRLLMNV